MAVTVIGDLHFRPEAVEGVLEFLKEILPDTRSYAGFVSIDVVQDQEDPGHILLVEQWDSSDHHTAYVAWRAETGVLDSLGDSLMAAPAFTYCTQRTDV